MVRTNTEAGAKGGRLRCGCKRGREGLVLGSRVLRIQTSRVGGPWEITEVNKRSHSGKVETCKNLLALLQLSRRNKQLSEETLSSPAAEEISWICQLPACCTESSRVAAFVSRHPVGSF